MSFIEDQGYVPSTIKDLMALVREGVNSEFGTSYDEDTFLGTGFYKFYYAIIQRLQENEIRTAEIVTKLQQYFASTNELIVRPNTTHPGLFDYFAAAGYVVSSKAPVVGDAGKLYVAVDVDSGDDDYAEKKLEICTILKDCTVAGVVTQGSETETIALSNDQSFDYKFNLPDETAILLKLTLVTSANNQFAILSPEETAQKLYENITARYRIGLNFEPQRYFSVLDAPWAASVLLQYSVDAGANWLSAVYSAAYDEKFTFELEDITIVES